MIRKSLVAAKKSRCNGKVLLQKNLVAMNRWAIPTLLAIISPLFIESSNSSTITKNSWFWLSFSNMHLNRVSKWCLNVTLWLADQSDINWKIFWNLPDVHRLAFQQNQFYSNTSFEFQIDPFRIFSPKISFFFQKLNFDWNGSK